MRGRLAAMVGVLGVIASLAGCVDDVGAEIARCEIEVDKAPVNSGLRQESLIYAIKRCMRAKGFDVLAKKTACVDGSLDEHCYYRRTFLDNLHE